MNALLLDPMAFALTFEALVTDGVHDRPFAFLACPDLSDWRAIDEPFHAIERAVETAAPISRAQYLEANDGAVNLAVARLEAGVLLGVAIEGFRQALIKREEAIDRTRAELGDAARPD